MTSHWTTIPSKMTAAFVNLKELKLSVVVVSRRNLAWIKGVQGKDGLKYLKLCIRFNDINFAVRAECALTF